MSTTLLIHVVAGSFGLVSGFIALFATKGDFRFIPIEARVQQLAHELIEFARTRLARYKCPTSVEFVSTLPRNASGKILKKELRAPHWAGRDRAIS